MFFEYYSNGCGTGKTTSIKSLIQNNPSAQFLVLVPSVDLANDYDDVGTVIVGRDKDGKDLDNVQKRISHSMVWDDVRVLVITQKAFQDSQDKKYLCNNRVVIQDEAAVTFEPSKWKMNNHKEWMSMFDVLAYNADWFTANVNVPIAKAFIEARDSMDDCTKVQDLIATPYDIWANNNKFDEHTQMFTVTKPDIYTGALKVIIACANFESTFQYHIWKNLYKVNFVCKEQFKPYDGSKATIHHASQQVNSITHNKTDSTIRDTVLAYIKATAKDKPVMIADNKAFATGEQWDRVNLNCHGNNDFRDYKHIAILAALNYENVTTAFLMDVCGMSREAVRFAHLGETAHQIAMRGVLRNHERNTEHCHIYVMEQQLCFYMNMALFNGTANMETIPNTDRPDKRVKADPLSQVDRNKANLIRKQWSKFKDISAEELKLMPAWSLLNSRGKLDQRKVREHGFTTAQINGELGI